jgi:hypothetical protein
MTPQEREEEEQQQRVARSDNAGKNMKGLIMWSLVLVSKLVTTI